MAALSISSRFTSLTSLLEVTLSMRHALALGAALLLLGALPAAGQSLPGPEREGQAQLSQLAVGMASMSAVTGYERLLVDTILRLLPGSARDRAGNARR